MGPGCHELAPDSMACSPTWVHGGLGFSPQGESGGPFLQHPQEVLILSSAHHSHSSTQKQSLDLGAGGRVGIMPIGPSLAWDLRHIALLLSLSVPIRWGTATAPTQRESGPQSQRACPGQAMFCLSGKHGPRRTPRERAGVASQVPGASLVCPGFP